MTEPQRPPPLLMDIEAAATHLGLGKRMLYRLVEARQVPHVRIGRRLFFDSAKVGEWVRALNADK